MELDTEFPVHRVSLKTGKCTVTYLTKAEADVCRENRQREAEERVAKEEEQAVKELEASRKKERDALLDKMLSERADAPAWLKAR